MGNFNLDQLTGKLAIGSLLILTGAITLQGYADIVPFIDWWTGTKTYDFFFAIPYLFLSYLLGLVVIRLSAILFNIFRKDSLEQEVSRIITVGRSGNDFITGRYEQLLQEVEVLQAACPVSALLGIVGFLNLRLVEIFPYGRTVFGILAFLLIAFIPLSLFLISKTRNEMKELSNQSVKSDVLEKSRNENDKNIKEVEATK